MLDAPRAGCVSGNALGDFAFVYRSKSGREYILVQSGKIVIRPGDDGLYGFGGDWDEFVVRDNSRVASPVVDKYSEDDYSSLRQSIEKYEAWRANPELDARPDTAAKATFMVLFIAWIVLIMLYL